MDLLFLPLPLTLSLDVCWSKFLHFTSFAFCLSLLTRLHFMRVFISPRHTVCALPTLRPGLIFAFDLFLSHSHSPSLTVAAFLPPPRAVRPVVFGAKKGERVHRKASCEDGQKVEGYTFITLLPHTLPLFLSFSLALFQVISFHFISKNWKANLHKSALTSDSLCIPHCVCVVKKRTGSHHLHPSSHRHLSITVNREEKRRQCVWLLKDFTTIQNSKASEGTDHTVGEREKEQETAHEGCPWEGEAEREE